MEPNTEWHKVGLMAALGAIGGAIRVCDAKHDHSTREIAASLLTSAFAGSLAGAALHHYVDDPVYLGAVCSSFGYLGQVGIVVAMKWLHRVTGIDFSGRGGH